jgi:hypothetical protein
MKNILVKANYEILKPDWLCENQVIEEKSFETYTKAHEISLESARKYLQDLDDVVVLTGKYTNVHKTFQNTWKETYRLWKEGHNLLFTDSDTIFINEVSVFGKYKEFRMFNHTEPAIFRTPNKYNASFNNFYNAGVRYYPSTMTQETWDIGNKIVDDWDEDTYDTEQIALNTMHWSQGLFSSIVSDSSLNFICPLNRPQDWWTSHNRRSVDSAKILHFCGTRGISAVLATMQQIKEKGFKI